MYKFRNRIEDELSRIRFLIGETEKRREGLGEGFLVRKRYARKDSYYEVTREGTPVSKALGAEEPRVREIKRHRFLTVQLAELKKNEKLLEYLVKNYRSYSPDDINKRLPRAYRQDLDPGGEKAPGRKRRGESELYSHIPVLTGHTAANGARVRSLAEILIYNELLYSGLNFEYEKGLVLTDGDGPREIYPDFTIERGDGEIVYWEHVGMFKDLQYREKFYRKLKLYFDNDILPGTNLILTFSAWDNSVNAEEIKRIIKGLTE